MKQLRSPLVVIAIIAGVAFLLFASNRGRKFGPLPNITPLNTSTADGHFYLYVSKRSFTPDIIDIQISIDGVEVVRDTFKHDLQVDDTRYRLAIGPGKHKLVAETKRGQAKLETTIQVGNEAHVGVAYYYSEPSILGNESPPVLTCYHASQPWMPEWSVKDAR